MFVINNPKGTHWWIFSKIFQQKIVNCSSEMVLSIRYSTIKKKEAARIEYPAIRTTSFVSIVIYLQREQRVCILNLLEICSTI
jgi:hypothetical protein